MSRRRFIKEALKAALLSIVPITWTGDLKIKADKGLRNEPYFVEVDHMKLEGTKLKNFVTKALKSNDVISLIERGALDVNDLKASQPKGSLIRFSVDGDIVTAVLLLIPLKERKYLIYMKGTKLVNEIRSIALILSSHKEYISIDARSINGSYIPLSGCAHNCTAYPGYNSCGDYCSCSAYCCRWNISCLLNCCASCRNVPAFWECLIVWCPFCLVFTLYGGCCSEVGTVCQCVP